MPSANCPTGSKMLRGLELERQSTALRLSGLSYELIGKRLGVSKGAAYAATIRAMEKSRKQIVENSEQIRSYELAALDEMQAGAYSAATTGDVDAIDAVLKIQKRRASLLGLDAPRESRSEILHGKTGDFMTREQKEAAVRDRLATLIVVAECPTVAAKHGLNSERLPAPAAEVLANA